MPVAPYSFLYRLVSFRGLTRTSAVPRSLWSILTLTTLLLLAPGLTHVWARALHDHTGQKQIAKAPLLRPGRRHHISAFRGPTAASGVSPMSGNEFNPPQVYETGLYPSCVASGDLNGDGIVDVVTTNGGDGTVSVLLGSGDGTFQSHVDYPTGASAMVAIADLNRDGKLDVITSGDSIVSVLLGNGDGTLQPHVDNVSADGNDYLTVGDFNGDGNPDVALSGDWVTGSVLLGKGDGTFLPRAAVDAGGGPIATADLNGDGILDLATAGFSPDMSVMLGIGDGTFQPPVNWHLGSAGYGDFVALGDLNGDGKPDVAVADGNHSETEADQDCVHVLLNDGTGNLNNIGCFYTGYNSRPRGLAVADFDGDGFMDIAASMWSGGAVAILSGSGGSSFLTYVPYGSGASSSVIAVDFNRDGFPDLAFNSGGMLNIMINTANGTPHVQLSTYSLDFLEKILGTRSKPQFVTVTSTGSAKVNISGIAATSGFLEANNCGSTLEVGASCSLSVVFAPKQKDSSFGTVTISDDADGGSQIVWLTGTGTVVQLAPGRVDFGSISVGKIGPFKAITLVNEGRTKLTIGGIGVQNSHVFLVRNKCPALLEPQAKCTIWVTFAPDSEGYFMTPLSVFDDGGASPQKVYLAGTGTR